MKCGRAHLAEQRIEFAKDPARRWIVRALWSAFDGNDEQAAKCAVIAWLVWPHVVNVTTEERLFWETWDLAYKTTVGSMGTIDEVLAKLPDGGVEYQDFTINLKGLIK